MDQSAALIASAVVTGVFGVFISWQNSRLHRAMKTNHGKRPGEYLEKLSATQDKVANDQELVALALVEAKRQVAGVASALVASEHKRDAEAKVVAEHIEADLAFQKRIEPLLSGATSASGG